MFAKPNHPVLTSFTKHCYSNRIETSIFLQSLTRNTHPNRHVDEVAKSNISLFEFAEAGEATAELDTGVSPYATRRWCAADEALEDNKQFACYKYTWKSIEYIVYFVAWKDVFKLPNEMYYVVSSDNADNLLKAAGKWTSELHQEMFVYDNGSWNKSKDLWKSVHNASWDNVVLKQEKKKDIISDVIGFFNSKDVYKKQCVTWKRGVIFHGSPGNGKTATIKAVINTAQKLSIDNQPISALYVKSFASSIPGRSAESCIREVFEKARASAPCILVFEDLDTLVGDKTRSYFLNEVDGFESNNGILMIATANDLTKLDPALANRPSRFDRKHHFHLPDKKDRTEYFMRWEGRLKAQNTEYPDEFFTTAAEQTEGFSFATLQELMTATLLAQVVGYEPQNEEKSHCCCEKEHCLRREPEPGDNDPIRILKDHIKLQRAGMKDAKVDMTVEPPQPSSRGCYLPWLLVAGCPQPCSHGCLRVGCWAVFTAISLLSLLSVTPELLATI